MEVRQTKLPGLLTLTPKITGDERGFFMEVVNKKAFADLGIDLNILQHNQSRSAKDVVRGLHFQWDKPLSKLIRVVRGSAFCVAADIRKNSSTFGQWVGEKLSSENKNMVFAPFGFATGFCALEGGTEVEYYYNAYYNPEGESNILWNDPDIGIEWGIKDPQLSPRDAGAQTLKEWLTKKESDQIV